MLVRNAVINDVDVIATKGVLLAQESENIAISYEKVFAGVTSLIQDEHKGFYLVVEDNEKIIGQLMITYEWSDWSNKPIWWIQSVYVDKRFRKQGVFTSLLKEIKKRAADHDVDILRLYVHNDNEMAIKTYEKIGMDKKHYCFYQLSL